MHSMASEVKSWNALEKQAAVVAKEGKDVTWLLATAVSRLRKRKKRQIKDKLPVPTPEPSRQ